MYESTVGYAEAFLTLTGLSEGSTYGIYCTSCEGQRSDSMVDGVAREELPTRSWHVRFGCLKIVFVRWGLGSALVVVLRCASESMMSVGRLNAQSKL